MSDVSYVAISSNDFQELKSAAAKPEMVGMRRACEMFDVSEITINKLCDRGMLTKYRIPGMPRSAHFRVSELQGIFKPSQD